MMNMGFYRLFQWGMALFLSPVLGMANTLDGTLVNPQAVESGWQFPDQVIDNSTLPKFSLESNNPPHEPLPLYRLTENTYFLFGNISTLNQQNRGWNGNAGFIVTSNGVIVIDTLGTPRLGKRLIATVRSVTDKPIKYLIVTHNHPDHAYGTSAFKELAGVTVIAHPGTRRYSNSSTLEESVAYRRELLAEDMQGFAPPGADEYVDSPRFGKKVLELGGQRIEIYNTGHHHSYGDLIVYQPDASLVWISDLAFNQRTTYMGDGDSRQILESQDWLMKHFSNVKLMVPGHGSPQTAPFPMVEKTRKYVQRLRQEMRQAVERGVPMLDAVQNARFEDWEDTRLYEQNHRANANYIYREMEKAFFEQ